MDLIIPPAQQAAYDSMTDPLNFPTEYLGWLDDRIKQMADQSSAKWSVGDYKVSAQTADHTDSAGGRWLICDGTSVDSSLTDLTALIGATRPDARGRALVMKGTHTDVDTVLDSDGVALANRTPKHNSTNSVTVAGSAIAAALSTTGGPYVSAPGSNGLQGGATPFTVGAAQNSPGISGSGTVATGGTIGPGSTRPIDTPAYIVPGNLFIHS